MKSVKVYGYSKCSTCKKALRWLDDQRVPYESEDIVGSPPSKGQLKQVLELSGLPIAKLFNTSGVSYREGKWSERLPKLSQAEALEALSADGKLIKRPLLLGDGFALVGFSEAHYEAKLAPKKR